MSSLSLLLEVEVEESALDVLVDVSELLVEFELVVLVLVVEFVELVELVELVLVEVDESEVVVSFSVSISDSGSAVTKTSIWYFVSDKAGGLRTYSWSNSLGSFFFSLLLSSLSLSLGLVLPILDLSLLVIFGTLGALFLFLIFP